jgi:hypothetical protein
LTLILLLFSGSTDEIFSSGSLAAWLAWKHVLQSHAEKTNLIDKLLSSYWLVIIYLNPSRTCLVENMEVPENEKEGENMIDKWLSNSWLKIFSLRLFTVLSEHPN